MPTFTDGGFRTSDEILDGGLSGLQFFDTFIPLYNQAVAVVGGGQNRGITTAAVYKPYDDLRGIDFAMMRVDADHLQTAIDKSSQHRDNLKKYWSSLSGWKGSAATSATSYNAKFDSMATKFVATAKPGPSAISGGVGNMEQVLSGFRDAVSRLNSGGTCGGMTPQDVQGAIKVAQGEIEGMEAAQFMAKVTDLTMTVLTGGLFAIAKFCGLSAEDQVDELRDKLMQAARTSLQNFITDFDSRKSSYDRSVQLTTTAVQRDYDTMLQYLKPMGDQAFTGLTETRTDTTGATDPAGAGTGSRTAPPTTSSPGGSGGTQPSSAGGQVSSAPQLSSTAAQSGTGTPGAPGSTVSPTPTLPTTPSTTATPTMPTVGSTSVPPNVNQPGKGTPVTITQDGKQVTLSPPDASGRQRVTITDPSGVPHTYDVDFGGSSTSASGASLPAPPGALPTPSNLGGPTVGGSGSGLGSMPSIGAIGSGGLGSGTGSTGSGTGLPGSLSPWSSTPAKPISAGADGRAVIHDGDMTITMEHPDGSDEVELTIDDGHGNVHTYAVDYSDPAHPVMREIGGMPAIDPLDPHVFGPTGLPIDPLTGTDFSSGITSHPFDVGTGAASVGDFAGLGGGAGVGAAAAGDVGVSGGLTGANSQQGAGGFTGAGAINGQMEGQVPQEGGIAAAGGGQARPGGAAGGGMGGMPMGGGMGGKGGEDKERGSNKYLKKGNLLDDDPGEEGRRTIKGGVIGENRPKK